MDQATALTLLEEMSLEMLDVDAEATLLQTPTMDYVVLTEMPNKKRTVICNKRDYESWVWLWKHGG